jgi:hypothetical protein
MNPCSSEWNGVPELLVTVVMALAANEMTSSQVKYTFVSRFRTFQDFEFVQGSTLYETHFSASYFTFQVGIADACTGLK